MSDAAAEIRARLAAVRERADPNSDFTCIETVMLDQRALADAVERLADALANAKDLIDTLADMTPLLGADAAVIAVRERARAALADVAARLEGV